MDLISSCQAFVQVGERGSFTLGAAAARTSQSVASRRIAALEAHFGEQLFDRTTRRAALTPFGRHMLPSAKRLVQLAETLEQNAEQSRMRPLAFAVPENCSIGQLAVLDAAASDLGAMVDFRRALPARRVQLLEERAVRVALLAAPPETADWVVALGVALSARQASMGAPATDADSRALRIESLRPSRARPGFSRLWIQPEDDVPYIRDRTQQVGHRAALMPAQIVVATSVIAAVADVLRTDSWLLCSESEASEWGLCWRPIADERLTRGTKVEAAAAADDDADLMRTTLWPVIARCLGSSDELARSHRGRTGE